MNRAAFMLLAVFGASEKLAQIAIVKVRVVDAVGGGACARSARAAFQEAVQWLDLAARAHERRLARQLAHQGVHVLELFLSAGQSAALPPVRLRVEPHREALGEVFIRMALRIPAVKVQGRSFAAWLRAWEYSGHCMQTTA